MPKPNRGSLSTNKSRSSEKAPHFKGAVNIDGTEYWVAGWRQTGEDGSAYISLSFEKKEERQPGSYRKPVTQRTGLDLMDLDDDIPF